jgi:hypothetical protein
MILIALSALATGANPPPGRGPPYSRVLSHLLSNTWLRRRKTGGAMPMLLADPVPRVGALPDGASAAAQRVAAWAVGGGDPRPRPDVQETLAQMQRQAKRAALATAAPAIVLVLVAALVVVLVVTAFYAFCARKGRRRSHPSLSDVSPLLYDTYRIKE